MSLKTDEPVQNQSCPRCDGQHFALVPIHRPDIPLHMEPSVVVNLDGEIVGYSGRLMCTYCNTVLPSELDEVLQSGKWSEQEARNAHPSNTPGVEQPEGNVIQFPEST